MTGCSAQGIKFWTPGAHVLHRGVAHGEVWIAHPSLVVGDNPERTLLLLVPGTHCKLPAGLVQRKHSKLANSPLSRWDEQQNPPWDMVDWIWRQRRFLIFMEPGRYYSIYMVWNHESNTFQGWYVNFELPFRRSPIGFDTLDLELDLLVGPDYSLRWKDTNEYAEGVRRGAITASMAKQIEHARSAVIEKVARREEPFDGHWIGWMPDNKWTIPILPLDWNKVQY